MRTIPLLFLLTAHCSLLTACSVTPLTNKIAVGEEAFVVAVGEGPDGMTDLFAAPAHGGAFVRLSFNRMVESTPRLSADGRRVVFLRRAEAPGSPSEIVEMSLVTGGERRVTLPGEVGAPTGVAWLAGEDAVWVRAPSGLYRIAGAPAGPALPC